MEVVNEYTYLGYTFTTTMSVTKGVDVLAAKGKRACVECARYIGKLSEISKKCFLKIFDTQVQPVILYSAEIWGLHRLSNRKSSHIYLQALFECPAQSTQQVCVRRNGSLPIVC